MTSEQMQGNVPPDEGYTAKEQLDTGGFEVWQSGQLVGFVWVVEESGHPWEWWALTSYFERPGKGHPDCSIRLFHPAFQPKNVDVESLDKFRQWVFANVFGGKVPITNITVYKHNVEVYP